jgi:hypothetical protein
MVLILAVLPVSCVKMPEWAPAGEGDIATEDLPDADAIPLAWGKLVSVTITEQDYFYQLWFQDEAGNVRMVGYDLRTNRLIPKARLFSRR